MATYVGRYDDGDRVLWAVSSARGLTALTDSYATTGDLLTHGREDIAAAARGSVTHRPEAVSTLSPITVPCRVMCQGANFRQHAIESGMDPDNRAFNLFFDKTDASVTGPFDSVTRPAHVELLDYEIELGLVIGTAIEAPVTITDSTLPSYVAAITIGNDLSARDVQLPQGQYLKGKSYRGFCPVGPVLAVLDQDDYAAIDRLTLRLEVDGELRQQDSTANWLYRPAETLTELSQFCNLDPGDVVLTGTPHGTAAKTPPAIVRRIATAVLPEHVLWKQFIRRSRGGPFLRPGSIVTASIRTEDGRLDLGTQRTPIVAPGS
ncbi:fumarylacetoacetate hydrolase family protein [Rhodococcoides corynebacterioides]|uniref:fumarylacetoacetate hydrolase family protein n=1 Tax=Rhodococcoides corynebacterioides TaxID=53972 RepID=UPI003F7D5E89